MRLRSFALSLGVAAALAWCAGTLVEAQTHPCDQPPPPTTTIASGAPHRVAFCARASDNIEAAVVRVDSQPFDLVPVTPTTQPNATGLRFYTTGNFLQVPRGAHTLTVALYNRNAVTGQLQLGPESSPPFTFAAVDDTPLPAAPDVKGIVR